MNHNLEYWLEAEAPEAIDPQITNQAAVGDQAGGEGQEVEDAAGPEATDAEEQEVRLALDTGTLEATGYALDLAYR